MTSDPGENNQVFIEFDTDLGGITVEDGKGMIPTPPCINLAAYKAFCGFSAPPRIKVNTGDGNDMVVPGFRLLGLGVIVADPPRTRINGGPGNDLLVGLLGSDNLIGGPGKDRLLGLYGSDTMSGGDGDDLLDGGDSILDGTNGRDRFFGGRGKDRSRPATRPGTCESIVAQAETSSAATVSTRSPPAVPESRLAGSEPLVGTADPAANQTGWPPLSASPDPACLS